MSEENDQEHSKAVDSTRLPHYGKSILDDVQLRAVTFLRLEVTLLRQESADLKRDLAEVCKAAAQLLCCQESEIPVKRADLVDLCARFALDNLPSATASSGDGSKGD